MRAALLRGRDHLELGAVDLVAEGRVALALSRGGARKRYAHTDPNEDCTAFAVGRSGTLLAVADAHSGFEASELALEHLLASPAPQWTEDPSGLDPESWGRHALATLCDANQEIVAERVGRSAASNTTLSLVLLLPERDLLLHASVGDSLSFLVRAGGVTCLGADSGPAAFLGGEPITPEQLAPRTAVGAERLAEVRAVVLATDGLSERGIGVSDPAAAVAEAAQAAADAELPLRPAALARGVAEAALAAQRQQRAGDNVGVAACWLGDH